MSQILVQAPVPGSLDRAHMCAIHRHIFGDVYDWAGQVRTAPPFPQQMVKAGPSPASIAAGRYDADDGYGYAYFPAGDAMCDHFDLWVRRLHAGDLGAMTPAEFAEAIGEPWGELNTAHLFREGNTRTQVAFFTYLARRYGHTLDYTRFSLDAGYRLKFNAGRFLVPAAKGPGLLIECLREVIDCPTALASVPEDPQPSGGTSADDYQPHYVSGSPAPPDDGAGAACGAPTKKGTACQRRGRCPYHQ
jgi:cell filamentation protein